MLVAPLNRRIEHWIARRHQPRRSGIVLTRNRIYILPSAHGFGFGLLLFVLFLWSVNYNNSMGFALTFFLAGIGLLAMWYCRNNLLGLTIQAQPLAPVFVGQQARFVYRLSNAEQRIHYDIELNWQSNKNSGCVTDVDATDAELELNYPAHQRGWLQPGRLRLQSRFPLGLLTAWSWLHFDQRCLVYPKPEGKLSLPQRPSAQSGPKPQQGSIQGSEDFAGLRVYRKGDSPRHVAWRASSRSEFNDLQVKRFAVPTVSQTWLDWHDLEELPTEARLSQLCQWVLNAEQKGIRYGLRLPDQEQPMGQGLTHRQSCLKLLALYGNHDATAEITSS